MQKKICSIIFVMVLTTVLYLNVNAQQGSGSNAQELADKLSNPVANMISVPFQNNLDYGIGPYNGSKYTINIQPVVPFTLSPNLNLITRYIIPVVDQQDVTAEGKKEFGLSDATVSAWFSPTGSKSGWIWGAGPAFLFPIGTNDFLSTRKWALGPTALVLRQNAGITYGFLTNQLWSYAGNKSRDNVNQMFLQPFFSKSWKSGASMALNSEIIFDWEHHTTTAYLNPVISGITTLGTQIASLALGPRIPLAAPNSSSADWGLRAVLTFVFPK